MIWNWIPLMTNNVDDLFKCMLSIILSSLMMCQFIYFAHFLLWLFGFWLFSFEGLFCYSRCQFLSDMSNIIISSNLFIHICKIAFVEQKFNQSITSIFPLIDLILVWIIRKQFYQFKDFLLIFLKVLVIHYESIFIQGVRFGSG